MRIANTKVSKSFFLLALVVLASVSATLATRNVSAAKSTMTFTYFAGAGPLCALAASACPDIAMADSGDTIRLNGTGTLSIFPNSVTGGGNFIHKSAAGSVIASGMWTATALVTFDSYGNGVPQGFPATFFGGRALIKVTLLVGGIAVHTGVLQITCLLGNPPTGATEGIRLNVQDAINFNKEVSGFTVYILST